MSGIEQGHSAEPESHLKHSREAGIAEQYAQLSDDDRETMAHTRQEMTGRAVSDPEHGEHNQMLIEEGDRKRAALHDARERLRQVEAGEVGADNKHQAWEEAMTRVEEAEQELHGFADNNPVRYHTESAGGRHRREGHQQTERGPVGVQTAEIAEMAGDVVGASDQEVQEAAATVRADTRGLRGRETRNYLGTEVQRGMGRSDKYKALANEVIARSIADKDYAKELIGKKSLGRDRSDEGISEAMAAAALPFLEQATIADMQGRPNRAAILRQAAADTANRIGRDMDFDQSMRVLSGAGADVSLNGVRFRPTRRAPNALKRRSLFERMGVSWKALRARD